MNTFNNITLPKGWEVKRVKDVVELITKKSCDSKKVALENIVENLGNYKESFTEFDGNGVQFEINDILYGKLRPYLRKVWLANISGNAVGDIFVFRTIRKNKSEYIKWLFLSEDFTMKCNGSTQGAKMPRVDSNFILTLEYPFPPLPVQTQIAAYLDEKTAQIDHRIALLNAKADKYRTLRRSIINQAVTQGLEPNPVLKPSGIKWIENIPQGWEVKRVKDVFVVINGSTPKSNNSDYWDGDINWITPADMSDFGIISKGENTITEKGYKSCGTTLIPKNSIVISSRAPIGKINLTANDLCTNQGCKSLVYTKKNIAIKYYYYYLIASTSNIVILGRGTTFFELGTSDLKSFSIPLPPLPIQTRIAAYLDEKTAQIDAMVSNIQKQVEQLNTLRRSIINQAVTGQKAK